MFTNENWRYVSMRCAIFFVFFFIYIYSRLFYFLSLNRVRIFNVWSHICTRFDLTIKNTRMNTKSQTQYFVRSFDLFMRSYAIGTLLSLLDVCTRIRCHQCLFTLHSNASLLDVIDFWAVYFHYSVSEWAMSTNFRLGNEKKNRL